MNGATLRKHGCYFGGGTCIALLHGEYRESVDTMMQLPLPALRAALTKAEQAYGPSVARDLGKAIDRLQQRAGWLERCMQVMAMNIPKAVLWQKVRALRRIVPKTHPCL